VQLSVNLVIYVFNLNISLLFYTVAESFSAVQSDRCIKPRPDMQLVAGEHRQQVACLDGALVVGLCLTHLL